MSRGVMYAKMAGVYVHPNPSQHLRHKQHQHVRAYSHTLSTELSTEANDHTHRFVVCCVGGPALMYAYVQTSSLKSPFDFQEEYTI